ncbi:hypothetical protein GYB22_06180 [bacterium]|nr:hypothetical protein [bacterium]
MKRIKLLSLALVATCASIFLTNCGPGEETAPKPVLEFVAGSEYVSSDISLAGDEEFTVGLRGSHTENIVSLKVTVSYNGGAQLVPANCSICDTSFSTKNLDVDFVGTTGTSAGEEVWSFTIADKDGNSTTKTLTITNLGTGGQSLIEITQDNNQNTLKVYNFRGPNSGAYDLVVGSNLLSADDNMDKDIQDSTAEAEISNWPARWTSRNGTTFKKMSTYNWGNVTNTTELNAAWNDGGTAVGTISVAKDDVYVAQLRGEAGKFVLIEITDVVSTSGDNLDYVQFRYKKQP